VCIYTHTHVHAHTHIHIHIHILTVQECYKSEGDPVTFIKNNSVCAELFLKSEFCFDVCPTDHSYH